MKTFLALVATLVLAVFAFGESHMSDTTLREELAAVEARENIATLQAKIDDLKAENRELRFSLEKLKCQALPETPAAKPVELEIEGLLPRLIVFSAPEWCVPCRSLEANIKTLSGQTYTVDGVQHFWRENIGPDDEASIQLVDCSDESGPGAQMAREFEVKTYPTTVRVAKSGLIESRFTGVMDADTLARYQAGQWTPPLAIDPKKIAKTP